MTHHISRTEATYGFFKFAVVGALAAFLAAPVLADDYASPNSSAASPQRAPAEDYDQPAASQQSSTAPREPTYVWQGNRPGGGEAPAPGAPGLPHAMQAGSIRYITGGIGEEERDALNAVKQNYNLHVVSTNNAGEFNGDTQISIYDRQGQELLNTSSAGPLFFADLPAGTYTVQAVSDGRPEQRKVTVGQEKSSSVYFRW